MKKFRRIDAPLDIAVIGGGAAGMMAAGVAALRGHKVKLFEKNVKLGRKLGITGKGRANITNNCEIDEILRNIPENPKFLYSALSSFSPADVMEFFEDLGVPVKTERGRRVFPESDRAADVVAAMISFVRDNGTEVVNRAVTGLQAEKGKFIVNTGKENHGFDKVIITTGGLSYPATGSTGDGYSFAKAFGHTVTPTRPSLCPLLSDDVCCREMQGLSLRNVAAKLYDNGGRLIYEDFGELLFTHFGLSGPIALSASSYMAHSGGEGFYILIDLKPALDEKTLDARILRDFEKYRNRELAGALSGLLHKSMIPVIIGLWGLPEGKRANTVTREERKRLAGFIKSLRIDITGPASFGEAVITAGGIKVSEIKPSTMESLLMPGLFFAGEIIDVDAMTGGYNLQIAWSTGFAAGNSV